MTKIYFKCDVIATVFMKSDIKEQRYSRSIKYEALHTILVGVKFAGF